MNAKLYIGQSVRLTFLVAFVKVTMKHVCNSIIKNFGYTVSLLNLYVPIYMLACTTEEERGSWSTRSAGGAKVFSSSCTPVSSHQLPFKRGNLKLVLQGRQMPLDSEIKTKKHSIVFNLRKTPCLRGFI